MITPVRRASSIVDGVVAGLAEDGVADGLRQLAQARQQPVAVGRIRHADLHAARISLDAALGRDAGVAQDAADVVAQRS